MPPKIRTMAKTILKEPVEVQIANSKPPETILQAAYICHDTQKLPILEDLFKQTNPKRVIIFSSSKVQLGTVLIYLCSFMLLGKFSGLYYEGIEFHDIVTTSLGTLTLIGLVVIHKHRKNLLNYDL